MHPRAMVSCPMFRSASYGTLRAFFSAAQCSVPGLAKKYEISLSFVTLVYRPDWTTHAVRFLDRLLISTLPERRAQNILQVAQDLQSVPRRCPRSSWIGGTFEPPVVRDDDQVGISPAIPHFFELMSS